MQYEINGDHATNHAQYSEYSGPPSETQEQAWEELIRRMHRVSHRGFF